MERLHAVAALREQLGGSKEVYAAAVEGRVAGEQVHEVAAALGLAALSAPPPPLPLSTTILPPQLQLPSYLERACSSSAPAGGSPLTPGPLHSASKGSPDRERSKRRSASAAVTAKPVLHWSVGWGQGDAEEQPAAGGPSASVPRKRSSQVLRQPHSREPLLSPPAWPGSGVAPEREHSPTQQQQHHTHWRGEAGAEGFRASPGSSSTSEMLPPLPRLSSARSLQQQLNSSSPTSLPLWAPSGQQQPGQVTMTGAWPPQPTVPTQFAWSGSLPPPQQDGAPMHRAPSAAAVPRQGEHWLQQLLPGLDACRPPQLLQRPLSQAGSGPAPLQALAASPPRVVAYSQLARSSQPGRGVSRTSRRIVQQALRLEQRLVQERQHAAQLAPQLTTQLPLHVGLRAGGAACVFVGLHAVPESMLSWHQLFLSCLVDSTVGVIAQVVAQGLAQQHGLASEQVAVRILLPHLHPLQLQQQPAGERATAGLAMSLWKDGEGVTVRELLAVVPDARQDLMLGYTAGIAAPVAAAAATPLQAPVPMAPTAAAAPTAAGAAAQMNVVPLMAATAAEGQRVGVLAAAVAAPGIGGSVEGGLVCSKSLEEGST